MVPARTRLVTRRSGSTRNRRERTSYDIFRWIRAVLINRTKSSYIRRSTPCFVSTANQLATMYICRISRLLAVDVSGRGSNLSHRNGRSGTADGSLGVGRSKSLLRRRRSSSLRKRASSLATRDL